MLPRALLKKKKKNTDRRPPTQSIKWNDYEAGQTSLLDAFVSFFGPDSAQRSIALLSF